MSPARACVVFGVGVLSALAAGSAEAQTGVLIGAVARDSGDHRLGGAEVSIASLKRVTTTNYMGEFRMDGLPPGQYLVSVRHVGFLAAIDTVDVKAGVQTLRDYVLVPAPVQLDSVRVSAPERKYISPALRGFEERRKTGFGHFITDSVLRQHDAERMSDVIRRIPGLNLTAFRSAYYAESQHISGLTPVVWAEPWLKPKSPKGCWITVYLDGTLLYNLSMGANGASATDFGHMNVTDLAGVEFYHGGASIPPQFNATDSGCGTLLLWTRER